MHTVIPDTHFRIGVVGYTICPFDHDLAKSLLEAAVDEAARKLLLKEGKLKPIIVVGGLTDRGVHGIAYKIAQKSGRLTAGIAPNCSKTCRKFPVDIAYYSGHRWGEEAPAFLANVDALVRVGGENSAHDLTKAAKQLGILVVERNLKTIPRNKDKPDAHKS